MTVYTLYRKGEQEDECEVEELRVRGCTGLAWTS